ncbi:MAG: hypothetical protein HFJ40_02265 [Clostridia bacterium]|nr:hypothetical protein [Clostridia bacterium]
MNKLTINDESINVNDLTIDFTNNEINIIEQDINSKTYRFFIDIMWKQKIDKLVYLKDKNGKKYTFYECYLGKHSIGNCIKISIKFNAYITDYYIADIKQYMINKITVNLEYKKFDMVNIEESLDKNMVFNIGKMHYNVELIFYDRYYKVVLKNDNKLTTEKFMHSFLLFYEFLILNLGYFLKIDKINLCKDEQSFDYYYPFSSKYNGNNNYNSYSCVLAKVNDKNIKEVYKKWLKIRKDSHVIYDIYMNVFSVKYFIEIALSTITNCMEGYYKCIHKSNLKKFIKDKKGNFKYVKKDFKDIMKEYLNSSEGKIIFTSKDRQTLKIYTKLTNHRNYFAHLDKERKRFYGESNLYMLFKIKLLFRTFILNDIGQVIDIDNLEKCVNDIQKYMKRRV